MIEYFNPNPTCKFFKSGKPKNWYINDSASYGFKFVTYGKPSKDAKRPSVKQFIEDNDTSNKIYVLNLADYFVCAIDNRIFDVSDNCLKSSVYSYWVKDLS